VTRKLFEALLFLFISGIGEAIGGNFDDLEYELVPKKKRK
jgi:hypothetical protein